MLESFGILVMRRLMTQKGKNDKWLKSGLSKSASTIRLSQKRMTFETLLACFCLFHKGAFSRLVIVFLTSQQLQTPKGHNYNRK
jgi:hypothetical protein